MSGLFLKTAAVLLIFSAAVPFLSTAEGQVILSNSGNGDMSSRLRNLAKKIDKVEEDMRKAEPESRKEMKLRHERESLSLEVLHEAQKYFLEKGFRLDTGGRKTLELMKRENKYFSTVSKKVKKFVFPDRMQNVEKVLKNIRSGKENFPGRIPKSDQALLRSIQKMQKEALDEFHKEERRSFK